LVGYYAIAHWTDLAALPANSLGDFAAGVVAPLAFLWLVVGYFQQGEELRQNTAALHLQAEELKGQKEALSAQHKQLQRQGFETAFFNLMSRHSDVIASLEFHTDRAVAPGRVTGREALSETTRSFVRYMGRRSQGRPTLDVYAEYYNTEARFVLPYFYGSLYELLRFIAQSQVESRGDYGRIVRAQLSVEDLVLLYLHGLSDQGAALKPLIEIYSLLEFLPANVNFPLPSADQYKPAAFGANTHLIDRYHGASHG
jgi:hypothetical protein